MGTGGGFSAGTGGEGRGCCETCDRSDVSEEKEEEEEEDCVLLRATWWIERSDMLDVRPPTPLLVELTEVFKEPHKRSPL